jgi:hypothetical protein
MIRFLHFHQPSGRTFCRRATLVLAAGLIATGCSGCLLIPGLAYTGYKVHKNGIGALTAPVTDQMAKAKAADHADANRTAHPSQPAKE